MVDWILENPVSCVCFGLAIFCLAQSYFFKKDFFSPPSVYCFSQSLTLGIAYLKLDPAMTDFHLKTWLFWGGAMMSFCVGAFCVRLVWKEKTLANEKLRTSAKFSPTFYNWKLHLVFSFVVFGFFCLGVFGIVKVAGNLLLLTGEPAKWMTKYVDYGFWAVLFCSSPLVILFFGVASFKSINPVRSVRWISRVMILVTIALNILAYPNRGTLFYSCGVLIIFYNYLHKRIAPALILICLGLAACAFIFVSSLRSQYGINSIKRMSADAIIDLPYKYVANNYWNFDYAINPPVDREYHPHTYGIDFFNGMFDYFRISGAFRKSFGWDGLFNERIEKVRGLNTASYLWEVYKDLYTPGIFLFPFLCGFALTYLHCCVKRQVKPRNVIFYALFIYQVAWWFFTPGYKQGIYWIWVVIMYVFTTLCTRTETGCTSVRREFGGASKSIQKE